MNKIIMLVGPIDYWWNENWNSPKHEAYMAWRNELNKALVEAGHLVYRPHEAFKGAWNELAQIVNNAAIASADVLIDMNPGVPAYGTEAELTLARNMRKDIRLAPPGDYSNVQDLIVPLEDPYGNVQRKTYTRTTGLVHGPGCDCDQCVDARNKARETLGMQLRESRKVQPGDDNDPRLNR